MADAGIGVGIEVIKAVAKHCKDLCSSAKEYPEDVVRIHLRLAYVLSRVPEWSNQITARLDDPGCMTLVQTLHIALTNLTSCVEALGTTDRTKWRTKIKIFLSGKSLHEELLNAESLLDQVLFELNHDTTSFIANQISILEQRFLHLKEGTDEDKLSLMITACRDSDGILSGNTNNSNETLKDVIDAEIEECYEEEEVNDDDMIRNRKATVATIPNDTHTTDPFNDLSKNATSL